MGRYLPLLERLDQWQADARADHPGVIPCRPGCSACCRGPFDISVADVELIREAVRALPSETRSYVVSRAADQVKAMQRLAPGWTAPYDLAELGEATFDRICDQLANLPCPCLDPDGRCLIYRSRPLVCRMMGLGMMTESGDPIDNACPIQHDYPDYAALEPRPFPLRDFEIEEDGAKIAAADRILGEAGRAGFETTIAGAITGAEDR